MESIILANGIRLPKIAFGTWTFDNKTVVEPVVQALHTGYRLIDTAAYYGNEEGVGKALVESGLSRDEVMVTSKVWTRDRGYKKTLAALDKSLKRLGTDHLDLYLIHWPAAESKYRNWEQLNAETWRALEDAYLAGKVRAIGVSNFTPKYLQALEKSARIMPMVNQIEYHPGFTQPETLALCKEKGIAVQAWSPFGRGEVFSNEVLQALAVKYGRTPAQVCLRWILDGGVLPVIKSANEARMRENLQVEGFALSPEDMAAMDSIEFFGKLGYDPERVRF